MSRAVVLALVLMTGIVSLPRTAAAHCDAMDGPVVRAAQAALERNDVNLVLRWVPREEEAGVRAAFGQTLAVRALGSDARALADKWFFETLVRIHRAGEGASFEGLKPAGHIEPLVAAVDRSLTTDSADEVVANVNAEIARGVRERFVRAREARAKADESVEAGRTYVAAYVEYVHYVERLRNAGASSEHELPQPTARTHSH